jgi:hypothetical protein
VIRGLLTAPRIAGGFLLLGILAIGFGIATLALDGNIAGLTSAFRGVRGIGVDAYAHQDLEPFVRPMAVLLVVGFGVLSAHLSALGAGALAVPAYGLVLVWVTLTILENTFYASVTARAGGIWESTGAVPELFELLRLWINTSLQAFHAIVAFSALALYAWAGLATRSLPSWVAGITIAGSVVGILGYQLRTLEIPGLIFVPILLIAVALLVSPAREPADTTRPRSIME